MLLKAWVKEMRPRERATLKCTAPRPPELVLHRETVPDQLLTHAGMHEAVQAILGVRLRVKLVRLNGG